MLATPRYAYRIRHGVQIALKKVWEPLLTPIEAAELLRIHPKTALRLARNHGIPAIRLGKHWRFRACDLNVWAESQIEPCGEFSWASS